MNYIPLRFAICLGSLLLFLTLGAGDALAQSPNCSAAVPNDNTSDTDAINSCLANQSVVILEDGGVYDIDAGSDTDSTKAIVLTINGRILQGEGSSTLPNLRAMDNLWAPIIWVEADNWQIHHVAFTGSSGNRTYDYLCDSDSDGRDGGSNMILHGSGWIVHDVVTGDALCGTGLGADGSNFAIYRTTSGWNGAESGAGNEPFADGMTIWWCDGGDIYENWTPENTDIGIVIGGGEDCEMYDNEIENTFTYAFAGIHVGWFGGYDGDHNNNSIVDNIITAWQDQMAFGLLAGFHPWSSSLDVDSAGSIQGNEVTGAVINLAIEGIASGTFTGNTSTNPQGSDGYGSCTYSTHFIVNHSGSATYQTSPAPVGLTFHNGGC